MHRPITVHIKGSTLTRMHTQARTGVHTADGVGLIESIIKSFELSKQALLPHFCVFVFFFWRKQPGVQMCPCNHGI